MEQFYVVLPSNAPTPGNTSSIFTVRLPETLHLDHTWSVALSSLTYCHSFPTIGAEKEQYIDIYFGTEHSRVRVHIGSLVINTIKELEKTINDAIVQRLKDVINLGKTRYKRHKRSEAPVLSKSEQQKLSAAIRAVEKALQEAKTARDYAIQHQRLAELIESRVNTWKLRYPGIANIRISRISDLLQKIQQSADEIERDCKLVENSKVEIDKYADERKVGEARRTADKAKTAAERTKRLQEKIKLWYYGSEEYSFQDGVFELSQQIKKDIEDAADEEEEEEGELINPGVIEEEEEKVEEEGKQIIPKNLADDEEEEGVLLDPSVIIEEEELEEGKKTEEKYVVPVYEGDEDEDEHTTILPPAVETEEGPIYTPFTVEELPELKGTSEKFKFIFDEIKQRFFVAFLPDPTDNLRYIELSNELAYVFGFRNTRIYNGDAAIYLPDLTGSIKQLYIYAPKLVESSIVGNVLAPLLRITHVDSRPGEVKEVIYIKEYFFRLAEKHINEISIEILTSSGEPLKFQWGNTELVLNFRKNTYF